MAKIFAFTKPLDKFTSVGSYPLFYLVQMTRGQFFVACAECATKAKHEGCDSSGTPVVNVQADIHWEGEPMECEDCCTAIESAYGIPE